MSNFKHLIEDGAEMLRLGFKDWQVIQTLKIPSSLADEFIEECEKWNDDDSWDSDCDSYSDEDVL